MSIKSLTKKLEENKLKREKKAAKKAWKGCISVNYKSEVVYSNKLK